MSKRKEPTGTQRICVSFTHGQVDLIKELVSRGQFGGNSSEVVKQIVLKYLSDRHILE